MTKRSRIAPPLALVAVGLLVSSASAAPRYKKSEVRVQATQTHLTKKPTKTDADKSAKARRERQPKMSGEAFRSQMKAKASKLTDAAIKTLNRLIRITPEDDPEKPDFYFRLAEHYRDKKVQYNFAARELDEQIFQTEDAARKASLKKRQGLYEKYEKQWMLGAIKLYLRIAMKPEYAKYKRMDEVLFNVADMLKQAKRHDKARIFFRKLIRNYPQSKYIPDAYLSFAEFYFNNNEVDKALKLYQRVGKYPDSPIYGYAIYKQGWCWLNLKDPRKALEMFVRVIKNANRWAGTKKGKIILVKEAKKDSVKAYAQAGTPDRAWNFFKRIGGSYAMTMLERLANIYYDQGKFTESTKVFRELMRLNPKSKKLCDWQYRVMRATLSGGKKQDQVVESRRLAAIYHLVRKRGNVKKSRLAECRGNASGVLRELATTWHREAQKTQNQETYALAQMLYKEYLDNFPNVSDAYIMSFYYAELLFKLEKWQQAANAYTRVVKMKAGGKHLKEAAYAAVISWKNALNVQEEVKDTSRKKRRRRRGKKGKKDEEIVQKPRKISENQLKMMAAFDTYLKYVPKAKERITIMYRKARIYYEHNHYDRASKMFADIAMTYPEHELAVYAANLLLDSLNILKRYEELEQWVYKLLEKKQLAKGELLATLLRLKRGIARKKLEQYQKTGRYREAAEGYAKLANEYPDDKRWAELAYNAALNFEAAKLIGQAIAIRNALIRIKLTDKSDKKGRTLAQKALYQVGGNYHALAWYSRAADYYERFAKSFPGEKEAPDALQNAIIFRLGRAEYDKARDNVTFFAKTYGKRRKYKARAASAVFSLGVVYETRGDKEGMAKFYKMYLRKWGRSGGKDRQILANVRLGRALWEKSCRVRGVHGACIKQKRVRSKRKIKKRKRRGRKKTIELRKQCGPETKTKITVFKRDPRMTRKALNHFKTAMRLSRKAKVKGASKEEIARRTARMKFSVAEAMFFNAERLFERFLEVKFPSGLDFSDKNKKRKKKSLKKFTKYLTEKGKLLNQARQGYQEVIKTKVPHWAIAGAARIGQLYQQFADALYTAPVPKPPIPKSLRSRDAKEEFVMTFTDTYCDTLEDKARPLEKKAIQGLSVCLNKSTQVSWYNAWSRLCERELNQIKPAEYPLATEIRAEPGYLKLRPAKSYLVTVIK